MNNRRVLLGSVLALPSMIALALSTGGFGTSRKDAPDRGRFRAWLGQIEDRDGPTRGLYPYFKSTGREPADPAEDFLSPPVTAKCILFWLEEGELERARRSGKRILYWQRVASRSAAPTVAGALPSRIERQGSGWRPGERFYSGDNLLILEALLRLYERTGDEELLRGADAIARWFRGVMCNGLELGLWREDHGAPMQFATADGDVDNRIFTSLEFLWLGALRHYGTLTKRREYLEMYEKAKAFLLEGQSEYGVWHDHYDPGWPPAPYDEKRWQWYGEGGVVVADNALRAALGALWAGEHEAVSRFVDWFRTNDGAVYAYLDAETGRGRFDPSTEPYYDVVVSGLWRCLAAPLERTRDVEMAERFLARTQNGSGGWYWGLTSAGLHPLVLSEAVLTGYWAVARPEKTERMEP